MKYVFIEKHQAEFSIQAMCRVPAAAGKDKSTRQQFRQYCNSVVHAVFTLSKPRYGALSLRR